MICFLMIHRIVDVINAPAGFITGNELPPVRYFVKPLNEYVEDGK